MLLSFNKFNDSQTYYNKMVYISMTSIGIDSSYKADSMV